MTTIEAVIQCAVCGAPNEISVLGSTNTFGSPDLDMRPPPMRRSTMYAWVQRCTNCGHCAEDLAALRSSAKVTVERADYREQLGNVAFPELANTFLCKALIDHESGELNDATWALLHGAWVCDDTDHRMQAVHCRKLAALTPVTAEENDQEIVSQPGASTVILVDMLRRSGQATAARKVLAERRSGIADKTILQLLDYCIKLIDRGGMTTQSSTTSFGLNADGLKDVVLATCSWR